jgi:hypothetical protein
MQGTGRYANNFGKITACALDLIDQSTVFVDAIGPLHMNETEQ